MMPAAPFTGRRILVIEDDYLVAQLLVELLEDAGAEVVGPAGWLEEAIELIEREGQTLDAAVLDVNLHGKRSYPIADALIRHSVGFLFATGYGAGVIDSKYQSHPRCEKPFHTDALLTALATLTAKAEHR
jgi:CheY-like chemotaxis protein